MTAIDNCDIGLDEIATWSVSFSGFVEKRQRVMQVWKLQWAVIDCCKLMLYADETESSMTAKMHLTSSTVVEAAPPSSEGSKQFLVRIYNPDQPGAALLIATPDSGSCEAWMIALIQSVNGAYRYVSQ
jgi:hypothetical protein